MKQLGVDVMRLGARTLSQLIEPYRTPQPED